MEYTKPALSYTNQLNLLLARKLDCGDPGWALQWLKRIGYYRLSAYFVPFRDPNTHDFRDGTTLEQIINLYKFDGGLRLLTMQAIDRIEVAVRAVVTYEMAHELGAFGYAEPANFGPALDHGQFMRSIAREEKRSSENFVEHFRTKYTSESYLPCGWRQSCSPSARFRKCMQIRERNFASKLPADSINRLPYF